ncbi:hypothetical protein CPB86DRAFT_785271 [Serendipita vermifera]|nr:hypothetical protein CPB86DRAFT_785271 [Serendipita vermifera]
MLHGILFHRLFGTVKPTTLTINSLDVTFPAVKDEEMEALVEDTVEKFLRALQGMQVSSGNPVTASPRPQPKREGQLSLSFVEVRQKKATWFNSGGEEEVPWETWTINILMESPMGQDRDNLHEYLSETLSRSIISILDYTASERGRAAVPPISTMGGISPFPIRTVLQVGGRIVT